jgi:hypothetical protein
MAAIAARTVRSARMVTEKQAVARRQAPMTAAEH